MLSANSQTVVVRACQRTLIKAQANIIIDADDYSRYQHLSEMHINYRLDIDFRPFSTRKSGHARNTDLDYRACLRERRSALRIINMVSLRHASRAISSAYGFGIPMRCARREE